MQWTFFGMRCTMVDRTCLRLDSFLLLPLSFLPPSVHCVRPLSPLSPDLANLNFCSADCKMKIEVTLGNSPVDSRCLKFAANR